MRIITLTTGDENLIYDQNFDQEKSATFNGKKRMSLYQKSRPLFRLLTM